MQQPILRRSGAACVRSQPIPRHLVATKSPRRSAFDCDIASLRVAAPQASRGGVSSVFFSRRNLRSRVFVAFILALLACCPVLAGGGICASQSSARGLATTSATAGVPACFTIEVNHVYVGTGVFVHHCLYACARWLLIHFVLLRPPTRPRCCRVGICMAYRSPQTLARS